MNKPAWRSVAKIIGVAIAKQWLQELERRRSLSQEATVSNSLPFQPAEAMTIETVSTSTKTERIQ